MNKFKFTGTNIAAALLILAYFLPWVSAMSISMSGFSIMSNGISPGLFAYFISGLSRLLMILIIVVPLCGALILYQNITGNKKFDKYYRPAHIIPCLYLILGIVVLYFKMKPEESIDSNSPYGNMSGYARDMSPGIFDILTFGAYLSLAAAIYLLLVSMGKIKDKEYYKPTVAGTANTNMPSDTIVRSNTLTSSDTDIINPDKGYIKNEGTINTSGE